MRSAILSDIHANLEAIRAVLARIEELRADQVLCLGDVAGYSADPNACVDLVRSEGLAWVMGNRDAAICGIEEQDTFNVNARQAVYWTRERTLVVHRVDCEIAACQDKIIRTGLPPRLAERPSPGT